jgi:hypothetical protein
VESSESVGKIERHDEHASTQREDMLPIVQFEAAYAAYEQVGDEKIQETPEDIDS